MAQSLHFRINQPKVIHEKFDDEVVIVNLESGNYYSLDKVGAEIWRLIDSGASLGDCTDEIADKYEGSRLDIENSVNRFVTEVQQDALIIPVESKETQIRKESDTHVETGPSRLRFEGPVLHKYTDMQDLLLLDPIHEVDETGWPRTKADSSSKRE